MEEMLTTKELADLLRLNEKKVYQLVRDGGVPHVRIAGKWLFPRQHVFRWIDENVHREKEILIVGSDDILMTRLISLYSQDRFPDSMAFYSPVGSSMGLEALAQRKGQACCTHLLDQETGEYNLPVLRRVMSGQRYVVVNLWHRKQGFIVKKGNPLAIRSLEDVIEKKARFVNRNSGAGTRVLMEYLLKTRGLDEKTFPGFNNEVDTHLGVALKIFFDEADVGLGIEYVTHFLGLDFIPVREERFDLVVPRELWHTRNIKEFCAYLNPSRITGLFHVLPGYDFTDTGKVIYES